MTPEARVAVIRAAVRWSTNMLVEVMGNHGGHLTDSQRDAVKRALEALSEFQ
jgi:hypothetical protein